MIAVGSAFGLGNDVIDAAQFLQVGGGDAHGLSSKFFLGGVAPHDGGAAFGRDHRVYRILHHQNAVGDRDRKCAAASADADHSGDDWHFESRHFAQVVGNGLGLAALFGMNSGISSVSIDKSEDR